MFGDSGLSIDRWLAVVGLVAAIFSLWLARYYYIKSVRTKILAIAVTNPLPLLLKIDGVSVYYLGREQNDLSRVFVLLWNRGTAPIEGDDFIEPIAIKDPHKVVSLKMFEKDPAADVRIDEEAKAISVRLLRPSECVIIQIDAGVEAYQPDFSVQMKSSDMSVVLNTVRAIFPSVWAWIVGFVFFVVWQFTIDLPTSSFIDSSLLFSIAETAMMLLSVIVSAQVGRISYYFFRRLYKANTSPVAWRFFERQLAVHSALDAWRSLNKQVDFAASKSGT